VEFRVLGQVEALEGDERLKVAAGRQLELLALLLVHANRVVSTDRILDELWGDDPPDSGAKTVAFHVSRLRDALAPGRSRAGRPGRDGEALATEGGGYLLRVNPDGLDAARFERLAAEGARSCPPTRRLPGAASPLRWPNGRARPTLRSPTSPSHWPRLRDSRSCT
jgi:DNA-binding SARP family transcriptional activator